MPTSSTPEELEMLLDRRQQLLDEIAAIGDLRPGSIVERYRKCGKPNCHCAQRRDGGHGPSWGVTWAVGGKTRNRTIPESALSQVREEIDEYHRFKSLSTELIEVSERICDAKLKASSETAAAEKGGFRKRSRRKSRSSSRG